MTGHYRAKRAVLALHSISHQRQRQAHNNRCLLFSSDCGVRNHDSESSQAVLGTTLISAIAACALSLNDQDRFALGRQNNFFQNIQEAVMQEAATVKPLAGTMFHEKYHVDWKAPELGYGAFGTVHLAHDKESNQAVAIKLVDKNQHVSNVADVAMLQEIRALKRIEEGGGHDHVVRLRDTFEDEHHHCVVLDLAKGGEVLVDLLKNEDATPYTSAEAARLIHQLASALDFLHNQVGLVHADVKPENLLLQDKNSRSFIALADFGSASFICNSKNKNGCPPQSDPTSVGTAAYWSPERFREVTKQEALPQPTPAMDMWSVGIVLYTLLTKEHPFDMKGTATPHELRQNIMNSRRAPKLPTSCAEAQPVLDGLLATNPKRRMTAAQLMKHPWVLKHLADVPAETK